MVTPADVLEHRARWALVEGDGLAGLHALPARSVDHVFTDPPYSEHMHTEAFVVDRNDGGPAFKAFGFDHLADTAPVIAALAHVAKRWSLIFVDVTMIGDWQRSCGAEERLRFVRLMPWFKPDGAPQMSGDRPGQGWEPMFLAHAAGGRMRWNCGGKRGVYECRVNGHGERSHPTQKPVSLLEALIRDFTDPDDVIADPYAGSGTTGVACLKLGRRFIGWEIDAAHAETSRRRLAETREQGDLLTAEAFRREAKKKRRQLGLELDEPFSEEGE